MGKRMNKTKLATLGLIFITFLSAIQYIFLQNVPDTVSTFSFLCITGLIGLIILGSTQIKKILTLKKTTIVKGAILAIELTGMNFFLVLGSKHLDSVIISSVVSMYFVFITPILLLLKKKVNFLSGIATVVAIIALLLMFGADTDALFSSTDVIYLMIADLLFAGYVVSISILGADEDSFQLTIAQMIFGAAFSFVGWIAESALGYGSFSLPTDAMFWISAVFIGVFIRAIYGILQMACQKCVPAINASLIFSAEIIITLLLNPVMCRLFGTEYTPATIFQVIGCVLFIVATLLVDDTVMSKIGFAGLETVEEVDESGRVIQRTSVSKKMIVKSLTFTILTLVLCMVVCLSAISVIRNSTVKKSTELGENASNASAVALTGELESRMQQLVTDKAMLADAKLSTYSISTMCAASFATSLYENPDSYPNKEALPPQKENAGVWVMQRGIANESIPYSALRAENALLGNMIDAFEPIVSKSANVATIYLGTESGLMLAYDPNSDNAETPTETYYEFRESTWYQLGKTVSQDKTGCAFTAAYLDSYGRGLTITCVAPFYDADGYFRGCVAADILMDDLNKSMVNDGIIDPNSATLMDRSGNIIASRYQNQHAEDALSIFDNFEDNRIKPVAFEILTKKNGIASTGAGNDAVYISYATLETTGWTLCIDSPVSSVLQPAMDIRDSIGQSTKNVVELVVESILKIVQECLIISALILLGVTFFIGKFSRKITDPLKKLEEDVKEISEGHFDQRTSVQTDDEIGSLARSFNNMTDSIQHYMSDLKEATAREERIAMELSVATKIQADLLPNTFPAFPDRKEFDIFASMTPAKEVGGDFYDFFMIDERHVAIVVADVSGKGVPAALFMVIGKTLIKVQSNKGKPLTETFYEVNNLLCETNKENLFITAFEGILDLVTGEFTFVNAGHEMPFISRGGRHFKPYEIEPGFVLAGMEEMDFEGGTITLEPGDKIFQYTDGVTEAKDANNKFYGMERLEAVLDTVSDKSVNEILPVVKADIDAFVGEAPQFDDITMLCLDFKERMEEHE